MNVRNYSKAILIATCLFVTSFASWAQTVSGQPGTTAKPLQSADKSMPDFTGQLPPELLEQLSLDKKQQDKLNAAQIARHSLWVANRRARQSEYDLIAKELENDRFDPREIIKLRKSIRQTADKRMDDVQSAWLEFWDSLNEPQRKLLVSYIKSQHRILGKAPTAPAAAPPSKSPLAPAFK